MNNIVFEAEWATQSAIMLAWPHVETDWSDMLDEVRSCFIDIITNISNYQDVILLMQNEDEIKNLPVKFNQNVHCLIVPTNDTWARDFGPLFIEKNGTPCLLDFKFNGWGLKFGANRDNLINNSLFKSGIFSQNVEYCNRLNIVLEGGSIESDGSGILMTTSECLLSPNRNGAWDKPEIEKFLIETFGLKKVLWLNNGYLAGDDTDSHIDTLARFCNKETIAYVQCLNQSDEHFESLKRMEGELKNFRTSDNNPYKLIPLPMAEPVYFDGKRLPATYANFLIINGAVLVPTYNSSIDAEALQQVTKAFPSRKIIGIDCSSLIKQHGSLHCVTMQLPKGVLKF